MPLSTLRNAFYNELRDVLSAEKQLLDALPKMSQMASSPELRKIFETHLEETEMQVERVENAFEETGKAAHAKKCVAMAGLIKEGESIMEEDADEAVMDALLIAAAQKIEHYEIATYGTLCTWAELLGYKNAKAALGKNIAEEEAADRKLTAISKKLNMAAKA